MTEETPQEVDLTVDETIEDSNETGSGLATLGITLGLAFATGAIAAVGNRVVHRLDRWIDRRAAAKKASQAIIIVEETESEDV